MQKILFLFFLFLAFFFLTDVKKVWADDCSLDCVDNLDKCQSGTIKNETCSTTSRPYCCQEKKSSSATPTPGSGSGIQVPTNTGLPSGDIMSVLGKTLDWLESVFLTLALIAFAIVGIMFLFSLGNSNSSAHTNAKAYFGQAVTALLIVGGSYILIKTINYLLQG